MLALKFNLTEEEFFEYSYFTEWSAPHRKSFRTRHYFRFIALYGIIAAVYIILNKSHRPEIDLAVFLVIALLYFFSVPVLIKGSIRRRVKQMLSEPENKHILETSEIILDDTEITDKDTVSETKYDWDAIIRKSETANCYFLYTNSYHAIVIPKRTLRSADDQRELQRLFNRFLSLSSEFSTGR